MSWRYSTKRHFGIIVCVIVRSSSKENCILACCFVRTHDISASLSVCHSQDIHRQRVHFGIHVCCSFYRERELDTGARLSVGRVCVCVCVRRTFTDSAFFFVLSRMNGLKAFAWIRAGSCNTIVKGCQTLTDAALAVLICLFNIKSHHFASYNRVGLTSRLRICVSC